MSQHQVRLLQNPYGESSYENIRKDGKAFVDKSLLIKELDTNTSRYPILLRPRRFGKSTFVQMLKCFYDISYADRYEEIFSGTDIYREKLKTHNSYHVLTFNFSGVSGLTENDLIDNFFIAINSGIEDLTTRYPDFLFKPLEIAKFTPSAYIKLFLSAYKNIHQNNHYT